MGEGERERESTFPGGTEKNHNKPQSGQQI